MSLQFSKLVSLLEKGKGSDRQRSKTSRLREICCRFETERPRARCRMNTLEFPQPMRAYWWTLLFMVELEMQSRLSPQENR